MDDNASRCTTPGPSSSFTDHLEFPAGQISIQLRYEDADEVLAVFEANIAAVGTTAEEAKENLKAAIAERYRYMILKLRYIRLSLIHPFETSFGRLEESNH